MKGRIHGYADVPGNLDLRCEVVVVGSGAGGGACAWELAEGGAEVVMLEEGPLLETPDYVADVTDIVTKMMRNGGATATLGNAPVNYLEGRCVGGSTVVNGAMSWRTPEKVLEKWRTEAGLADMTPENLEPLFERIEETISARRQDAGSQGNNNGVFKKGCDALGFRTVANIRNQVHCVGTADCVTGCPTGAKQSTLLSYVPRFLASGGNIFAGCRVDSILTDAGRAVGVSGERQNPETGEYDRRFVVRADTVVLACGAVQTPLLLLRNRIANSSDQVGRNFTIHPNVKVTALFDFEVRSNHGAHQAFQCREFQDDGIVLAPGGVAPAFLAVGFDAFGAEHAKLMRDYPYLASGGVLVDDYAAGRVKLGPFGFPMIRYDITPQDQAQFMKAVDVLSQVYFAAGAKRIFLPFHGWPALEGPDDLPRLRGTPAPPEDTEYFTAHLMGTCRADADPKRGVVDPWGECHDVKGLYIADASVFPGPIGVNPMESIMMLATRTAHRLLEA